MSSHDRNVTGPHVSQEIAKFQLSQLAEFNKYFLSGYRYKLARLPIIKT